MHDVFISYSWEGKEHNESIISFVNFLRKSGFNAICDVLKMQENGAIHFGEMMASGLTDAKKVIIILSPGYKNKADNFDGGVGSEFRFIIEDINDHPEKYILASFESINREVINQVVPEFLKGREIVDLKEDEDNDFRKLFSKLTEVDLFYFEKIGSSKPFLEAKRVKEFTLKDEKKEINDIKLFDSTTNFFDYRLSKAFPGIRGLAWFDPEVAINRLEILLRYPLNNETLTDPIWFFRGSSCLDINRFQKLNDEKCLIGYDECKLNRLAVYKSIDYYRSFVYVEFKPEDPTGLYPDIDKEFIEERLKHRPYFSEEYAIYDGVPITRMEYDDGAAVIDGEVVDFDKDAELRIRYLTPYNIILCAKFHPFNSQIGDKVTRSSLDGMLNDDIKIEELIEIAEKLPRHPADS